MIAGLYQGGLTLPGKEYYAKSDSSSRETRERFVAPMERMFALMGDLRQAAAAEAATVLQVETAFALASKSRVELRDPQTSCHRMFSTIPLADWKSFLRWRLVHRAAPSLTTAFVKENFAFSRVFSGATELLPRRKRCASSTDNRLGELLGQACVN